MTVGDLIRKTRKKTGKSIEAFAPEVGISRAALAMYERGERLPDVDFLAHLAKATGADFAELVRLRLEASGIEGIEALGPASAAVFAPVPVYEVKAAAGLGALVESEEVETEIAFRINWLRTLGVPREHLAVIYAAGDSMEPTICAGDAVLLEREPERLIEGAIYVIERGGELMIKRPQPLAGGELVLRSDNPAYQPVAYTLEEAKELRFVGRALWIGRSL